MHVLLYVLTSNVTEHMIHLVNLWNIYQIGRVYMDASCSDSFGHINSDIHYRVALRNQIGRIDMDNLDAT